MWSNRFNLLLSNPKQNVQLASAKTTRVLGNKCDLFLSLDQSDPIYVQQILHETSNDDDDAVLKEVKIRE
jgi:hypothetical protein